MSRKFGLSVVIISAVFVSQLILEIEAQTARNADAAPHHL